MKHAHTIVRHCEERSDVAIHPRSAFTMAEILLSLTIIGVVAAITLPSLTGNVNERVWNTQKKALYARFSQAIALMPYLSGYGTFTAATESVSAVDTAAETFVTEGLSKVIKINNICDNEHLQDCGIPTSLTTLAGSASSFPTKISELNSKMTSINDTKAAAFETQNGESVLVFYNPQCQTNLAEKGFSTQPKMCANFVYDLNGNKGPNAVGKDIGIITAIYSSDPVIVAPQPLSSSASGGYHINASAACTTKDSESRLPNKEELSAMYYNMYLFGISNSYYWASTLVGTKAIAINFSDGWVGSELRTGDAMSTWCIKR